MPIDTDLFQSLSQKKRENWKIKLEAALSSNKEDLILVEKKLKTALMEDETSHAELIPLLSYRSELKLESNHIKDDLEIVNKYLNKGQLNRKSNKISNGKVNMRVGNR